MADNFIITALAGAAVVAWFYYSSQPKPLYGRVFKPVIINTSTGKPITPKPTAPRFSSHIDSRTGLEIATY